MSDKNEMYAYLTDRLTKIETQEEADKFLRDLCTYAELDNMAQRLFSAKLVLDGLTYNQVMEETQISTATLSRVSSSVKHGSGGYRTIIEKK